MPAASFDAVICIDAINHLPDRPLTLAEWARVLKPGGRVLFTDPITVTGPLTNGEIAIRSSIAFFLFVPSGYDEQVLHDAGFELVVVEDRTDNTATVARRWPGRPGPPGPTSCAGSGATRRTRASRRSSRGANGWRGNDAYHASSTWRPSPWRWPRRPPDGRPGAPRSSRSAPLARTEEAKAEQGAGQVEQPLE